VLRALLTELVRQERARGRIHDGDASEK
jgi:hypothetical protein